MKSARLQEVMMPVFANIRKISMIALDLVAVSVVAIAYGSSDPVSAEPLVPGG